MYKEFTEREAWQYIIKNIPLIKHCIYNKNIFFNREDILQDTILLLFNKISNKTLKITAKGNIFAFKTIVYNAIVDVLKTNYAHVGAESPVDCVYISDDFVC
jgi:hypothetical protein